MKNLIQILLVCFMQVQGNCTAQELLNPYKYYGNASLQNLEIYNLNSNHYFPLLYLNASSSLNNYTGEYEMLKGGLDLIWDQYFTTLSGGGSISYKMEVVSFPFTMECAYNFPDGCADGGAIRQLFMPKNSLFPFNTTKRKWESTNGLGELSLQTPWPGSYSDLYYINNTAYKETHQNLISTGFCGINPAIPAEGRTYLPHTVIKHVYYLHCGPNPLYDPVADSIVWVVDNTRGRMRYYPFLGANVHVGSGPDVYDVCFVPQFVYLTPSNGGMHHNYGMNQPNLILNYKSLNYFPYSNIPSNGPCSNSFSKPFGSDVFGDINSNLPALFPYPAPYVLFSAPARNHNAKFLAGYEINSINNLPISQNGILQQYHIDKGFPDLDLNWINPHDKIIFNPSDVTIGPQSGTALVNVIFPHHYTFKTILGVYPSLEEVNDANTIANGGIYADLRDVPVPVNAADLMPANANPQDYPDVSSYDDPVTGVDERFGNYSLQDHSKINVEQCVKIFDANFYVNPGASIVFEDYPSIINERRFAIEYGGGAVLKNYSPIQYLQNASITQNYELKYFATNEILAGENVAPNIGTNQLVHFIPVGEYVIEPGNTDVKLEAGNQIKLEPGFSAKEGCSFTAKCNPIQYAIKLCAAQAQGSNRLFSLTANQLLHQTLTQTSTKKLFSISPNPGQGIFTILLNNNSQHYTIEVKDVYGRTVAENSNNSSTTSIDLSNLANCMYFVNATLDGKQMVEKIMKQ